MCPVNGTLGLPPIAQKPSLRDYLADSLSNLSNAFPLGLTVLSSSPKRTGTLFPHAVNPPRAFEKEYLVTLHSTQPNSSTPFDSTPVTSTSTTPQAESGSSSSPTPRPVLVVAIHAYLYTLPTTHTSILYISKVDTSGHAHPHNPIPLARTLLIAFLGYHLDPTTRPSDRVQICLFARSQGQYLFPNSVKAPGKRVSGGLKLCAWWKGVYVAVATEYQRKKHKDDQERKVADVAGEREEEMGERSRMRLRYVLPSYSEEEARGMLGKSKIDLPPGTEWKYVSPFSRNLIGSMSTSSAIATGEKIEARLAWSIPALPDDPKTRFMEEIVLDSGPYTHQGSNNAGPSSSGIKSIDHQEPIKDISQERPVTTTTQSQSISTHRKDKNEAERRKSQAALDRVGVEEFWERMGFRQECSSGDVTGFFHLDSDHEPIEHTNISPALCSTREKNQNGVKISGQMEDVMKEVKTELPILIVDRIHQSLLNCDFGTEEFAIEGSGIWLKSTEALVKDEIGDQGWKACTAEIPAKANIQSAGVKRKDEGVTMLQIRKKPKKARPA